MYLHESPSLPCVSLVWLPVPFPTSVLMFLGMCLHLWEEGRQGREKQPLQNPGSGPKRPTEQRGGQGAITSGSSWPLAEPSQEDQVLTRAPPTPRRSLG